MDGITPLSFFQVLLFTKDGQQHVHYVDTFLVCTLTQLLLGNGVAVRPNVLPVLCRRKVDQNILLVMSQHQEFRINIRCGGNHTWFPFHTSVVVFNFILLIVDKGNSGSPNVELLLPVENQSEMALCLVGVRDMKDLTMEVGDDNDSVLGSGGHFRFPWVSIIERRDLKEEKEDCSA